MEDKNTKIKTMPSPICHEKSAEMKIRATEPRIVQAQVTAREGAVPIQDYIVFAIELMCSYL